MRDKTQTKRGIDMAVRAADSLCINDEELVGALLDLRIKVDSLGCAEGWHEIYMHSEHPCKPMARCSKCLEDFPDA